jgi:hypothetical protein
MSKLGHFTKLKIYRVPARRFKPVGVTAVSRTELPQKNTLPRSRNSLTFEPGGVLTLKVLQQRILLFRRRSLTGYPVILVPMLLNFLQS